MPGDGASSAPQGASFPPGRRWCDRAGMKTIGVIGGMGPQATMDFEQRFHRIALRTIPPFLNTGYPPMIVVCHRRPPVAMDEHHERRRPLTADPGLIESAHALGASVDFLVITSNFTHVLQPEIERASGRAVLSMIDVTLQAVRARRWTRVGVVGMGLPAIYTDRLGPIGITAETLPPERIESLDRAILALMEGRETDEARRAAREAIAALRERDVEGIILGCTEIPLLLGTAAEAPDLLNPAELLAEAAVAKAIE